MLITSIALSYSAFKQESYAVLNVNVPTVSTMPVPRHSLTSEGRSKISGELTLP